MQRVSQARVVVVGSVNMDLVARAARLPRPGETVLGRDFTTVPGGKGANQAVAAARAGAATSFIGAVGEDSFGPELRLTLQQAGVDITQLRTAAGPSGVALIMVDDGGENSILVAAGANATLERLTEPDRTAIAAADVLLCQLEIPVSGVHSALAAAREGGTRVILNAAPARPLNDALLELVDLLVVNEGEAAILAHGAAGQDGAGSDGAGSDADGAEAVPTRVRGLLDTLLAKVPRVALTLGAAGAVYAARDTAACRVPAPRITPVDTTAAGDAFTGALAVAWAEGRELRDAVRWACAAGACCAQRLGASTALPTRADIDQLYAATYLPTHQRREVSARSDTL